VIATQTLDQLAHLADLGRVEPDGGLVQHDDLRVVHQRLGQAHPLAVALRQLGDEAVAHALQPAAADDPFQHDRQVGFGYALDPGHELQVFAHGELGVERDVLGQIADLALHRHRLLEHVEAAHPAGAPRGGHVTGQDAHGRGLAGAVWPEEPQDLAALDREADVLDGFECTVILGQSGYFDHKPSWRWSETSTYARACVRFQSRPI